jgi:hypothetical protein
MYSPPGKTMIDMRGSRKESDRQDPGIQISWGMAQTRRGEEYSNQPHRLPLLSRRLLLLSSNLQRTKADPGPISQILEKAAEEHLLSEALGDVPRALSDHAVT